MPDNTMTVNMEKCKAEARMVGYLLGLKVANKDPKFVPPGIDDYHTLPLRSLNRVATKAAEEILQG